MAVHYILLILPIIHLTLTKKLLINYKITWKMMWSTCQDKEKSESSTGREPTTFRTTGQDACHTWTLNIIMAQLATSPLQQLEHPTSVRKVIGSIPAGDSDFSLSRAHDMLITSFFISSPSSKVPLKSWVDTRSSKLDPRVSKLKCVEFRDARIESRNARIESWVSMIEDQGSKKLGFPKERCCTVT